jgi:redox-sensitive bicupin YhaK (pirin superfamily)
MSVDAMADASFPIALTKVRPIQGRTRGQSHAPITRLMSPGDLGQFLKPFVFLDIFEGSMARMQASMPLHPHSGIATVTVFSEGDVAYDDPEAGRGTLAYGGVEWMRAGGGVWHGKELSKGQSDGIRGFQLWVALPPELETGPAEAQYIEAHLTPSVGPARLIVGQYQHARSPIRSPDDLNYLLVTLRPGEAWVYDAPVGQTVAWLAISSGELVGGAAAARGEMAVFEPGEGSIALEAGPGGAVFVLGSAAPHDWPLHLGYYSVHTSAEALRRGEENIEVMRRRLEAQGRLSQAGPVPIQR